MTYSVSGLIQALDYNGFVSANTPNVNAVWSTGSSNRGYGQSALTTVNSGELIFASSWLNLINTIGASANHQGTTLGTYLNSTPGTGNLIQYESNLLNNINLIDTNRLNAAAQGGTSSTTATTVSSWVNNCTITFTVTFSGANSIRYFFNAGGQIGLSFSHPAGVGSSINQVISDICSEIGTVWLSSPTSGTATLSGTPFNGVTKVGGVDSIRGVANTNNGFYALTGSPSQLYIQYSDYAYHSYTAGTFLSLNGDQNGSGVLTISCLFDEVPDGATVSSGTGATLTVRPPSTTYLTNSWGTPVVAYSIVSS